MNSGDEIGDHRRDAVPGTGSQGRVFRATDRKPRRPVAVERPSPPAWSEEDIRGTRKARPAGQEKFESLIATSLLHVQRWMRENPRTTEMWAILGRAPHCVAPRDQAWACLMLSTLSEKASNILWSPFHRGCRADHEAGVVDRPRHEDSKRPRRELPRGNLPPPWSRHGFEETDTRTPGNPRRSGGRR